ncbi:MAG: ribosomal protein L11 methyltransferase [Desulforhopalus sp.]|jgi:ribosomal protein L11 methyltransferase
MTTKKWLQVTVTADPVLIEPVSDFLVGVLDAGVEAAAIDEPDYGTVNGYVQDPDLNPEEVKRLLEQVSGYLTELKDIFNVPAPQLTSKIIEDEDWGKSWKEHFKPFAIVPGLVIVPTWEEYVPADDEAVITMDPGMAFGTGHHATTSLTLEFIRESLEGTAGKRLLDVGTGTGILGMAGLLFNAGEVTATDNDPDAVKAATDNVAFNGLQEKMNVSLASLSELDDNYDVVIANIVHNVLVSMADDLIRLTKKGGYLILSGLLAETQVGNIREVFCGKGLRFAGEKLRAEWAAIRFVKD